MKRKVNLSEQERQASIVELVRKIQRCEEALRELTGDEVDAVTSENGQLYLLHDAQEKLRQSEERFNLAARGSMAAIWDWNLNTDNCYFAPRFAEMLGYSQEEFPHHIQTLFDLVHPDDLAELKADLEAHFTIERRPSSQEFRVRMKSGDYLWVSSTGQAIYDESGKAYRMAGSTYDISVRKKAESNLKASLAEANGFREALNRVPSFIYMKDAEDRYTYANQPTLDYFKCSAEELIGSKNSRFFPPAVTERLEKVDARVLNGEQTGEEIIIEGEDFRKVYWEVKTPIYQDAKSKKPCGLLGISTDITHLRQQEENLRLLETCVAHLNDMLIIAEIDAANNGEPKVIFVNEAFERNTGFKKDEVIGKNHRFIRFKKSDESRKNLITNAIEQHLPVRTEIANQTKEGKEYWVELDMVPIFSSSGVPTHFVAVERDITERKKMEAHLLRAQRIESIGTLAGGIAHDLNNILSPITIGIDLLKLRVNEEDDARLLSTMESSARRGTDLVRQVLSFAKGTEGSPITVNPKHLANEVATIVADTFPKNIEFHLIFDRDLWTIEADPTQIHQILMNLCVNARDAMPSGGRLTLGLNNTIVDGLFAGLNSLSKPGPYVVLSVQDTGSGMSPEIQEQIFDPFFTTKELGKGTGLGLSTAVSIAKSHGGFLHVYSELSKGTIFKVYIPAGSVQADFEPLARPVSTHPRGNGETVLVVDDEEAIRQLAQKTLECFGYKVFTAANGAEAVAIYATHQSEIQVVITDMAMPIMDGPATVIALKAIQPDLRIIGASGLTSAGGLDKSVRAGIHHFIAKPYTAEALLGILQKSLPVGAEH